MGGNQLDKVQVQHATTLTLRLKHTSKKHGVSLGLPTCVLREAAGTHVHALGFSQGRSATPNPPTPSAVERLRTTFLCLTLSPANPGRIHVLPSPFRMLTTATPVRIHDLLKSQKSQKLPNFNKNGTPEALDERNQYSGTSRSHWEGSQALARGPGPQKLLTGPQKLGSSAWRSL